MNNLKSNKNVKYLLPAVLVIWGLFFFRLFDACSPDSFIENTPVVTNFTPPKTNPKTTFDLLPIEKDPFLGAMAYKSQKSGVNSPNKNKNTAIPWPNISFLGIVSDIKSKKKVFILNINGKQELLHIGDKLDGLKLMNGNEDRVILQFNSSTQEFKKQ